MKYSFEALGLTVTVASLLITGFGFFSVTTNVDLLRWTCWTRASVRYDADGGYVFFMGLRAVVTKVCHKTSSTWSYKWDDCTSDVKLWSDFSAGCSDVNSSTVAEYGEFETDVAKINPGAFFGCDYVNTCRDTAQSNQFGAFMTFVTLIFAIIGCMTRIKRVADSNIQKVIGCIPDTLGVFTLLSALVSFRSGCFPDTKDVAADGEQIVEWLPGLGYGAYWFCWVAQLIRVMIHFGTPVADYERAVEHVKEMNIYEPKNHPRYATKYESSNKNTKDEGAENVELSVKSPSESVNTDDFEEP